MHEGNAGEIDFGSSQHELRVSEGSSYWESTVQHIANQVLLMRMIPDNVYASISSHFHSRIGKSCRHSRAAKHIKCPLFLGIHHLTVRDLDETNSTGKQGSRKYKQAITKISDLVYHLLTLWKFTRRTFPFYTSEIHKNNIFFFQNGLPTLIPRSHFYFLYLICFQTVFSVFCSSSDASTYIQIENPSLI